MDANQNSESSAGLGTQGQANYIIGLSKQLGYSSVQEAVQAAGGTMPLTAPTASRVIETLKQALSDRNEHGAPATLGGEPTKRRYMTARNLLQVDAGVIPVPDELDEDAAEVLKRLAKLREVERALGTSPQWLGVNAGGPIQVDHLVRFFGSTEAVALQFGVSVETVKAWGKNVPQTRAFEAQVRTKGHVCAPR